MQLFYIFLIHLGKSVKSRGKKPYLVGPLEKNFFCVCLRLETTALTAIAHYMVLIDETLDKPIQSTVARSILPGTGYMTSRYVNKTLRGGVGV